MSRNDFLSFLCSKLLRQLKKPKFKVGERVFIYIYDLSFRMEYKLQYTQKLFGGVSISSRKLPTYAIKNEQDEVVSGKFCQKELIKIF